MQTWEGGQTPWSWDLQAELTFIIPAKSPHRSTLICVWLNNLEKIRGFQGPRTLGAFWDAARNDALWQERACSVLSGAGGHHWVGTA